MQYSTFQRSSNLCVDLLVSLLKVRTCGPGRFIVDVILNPPHVGGTRDMGEDVVRQAGGEAGVLLLLHHCRPILAK